MRHHCRHCRPTSRGQHNPRRYTFSPSNFLLPMMHTCNLVMYCDVSCTSCLRTFPVFSKSLFLPQTKSKGLRNKTNSCMRHRHQLVDDAALEETDALQLPKDLKPDYTDIVGRTFLAWQWGWILGSGSSSLVSKGLRFGICRLGCRVRLYDGESPRDSQS